MKTKLTLIDIVLATALLATIVGCSALQTKPPTAVEAGLYQIVTNTVTVTNTPPPVTNYVQVPFFVTNTQGTVIITNVPTPVVTQPPPQVVTNIVGYQYTPAPQTTNTVQTLAGALNIGAPGIGTLVGGILTLAVGVWGSLRSKTLNPALQQAATSTAIATNTVQAIETARNVIATLSPAAATAYNNWLVSHQQDANIANEVGALVDQVANTNLGQAAGVGAASQIITAATTPIPVATVAKPA